LQHLRRRTRATVCQLGFRRGAGSMTEGRPTQSKPDAFGELQNSILRRSDRGRHHRGRRECGTTATQQRFRQTGGLYDLFIR
jgi:hypothetical protein